MCLLVELDSSVSGSSRYGRHVIDSSSEISISSVGETGIKLERNDAATERW